MKKETGSPNPQLDQLMSAYMYNRFLRDEQQKPVDFEVLQVNSVFEEITGRQKADVLNKRARELWPLPEEDRDHWLELLAQVSAAHPSLITEQYSAQTNRFYRLHVFAEEEDCFSVHFLDITEFKAAEAAIIQKNRELEQLKNLTRELEKRLSTPPTAAAAGTNFLELSDRRFKVMVNNLDDIVYSCNLDGSIIAVNKKFCEIARKPEEEIIGKDITRFLYVDHMESLWQEALVEVVRTKKPYRAEYAYSQADDTLHHYQLILAPIFDRVENIIGVSGLNHNITHLKQNEQKMTLLAYYDSLTGLPNKTLFMDRLNHAISISRRNGSKSVVAFIDIDDFKKLNDTFGYENGNQLLVHIGNKLGGCLREYDTIARSSEDKFLLLIQHIRHINELFPILDRIRTSIREPIDLNGQAILATLSIGVSVYPDDGAASEEILINAEVAMYKAKDLGKNSLHFFNYNIKQVLARKTQLEMMLKNALKNNEFILHYQSQYEARTRRLRGFETLIRWNNPEMGLVMPSEFLPVAEESDLILEIGEWMIQTACQKITEIKTAYEYPVILSVNISEKQLYHPDFYRVAAQAVQQYGVAPGCLELEIAAGIIDYDFNYIVEVLKSLNEAGVRIAVSDFGSGQLSFNHLMKLPIRLVKMDKSFFEETGHSDSQNLMTASIISFAHKLNIELLAEGVETQEQVDYLIRENCDNIQGFFLEEPVAEESLGEIITKGLLEKKAVTRLTQKAGLTYEGLFRPRKQQLGGHWDEKQ
ncbi:MAG: EAL domain-containing protein [Peptococcaceae bacterium]|jgi:polar amino acid transport system substrate-binding protein|nr:EAL domain-containing protein [Peptococcaceae bacterium]